MKRKLAFAIALALAAAGAASGAEKAGTSGQTEAASGGPEGPGFGGMDKNKDGYLTEDEMKADQELSAQMGDLDKNKDNKLDETEFGGFEATGGGAVR